MLCFVVSQGRQLLYGWMQEHRRVPTPPALCDEYSYAGCISTPRVLQLVEGQLWQTPLPEINTLRTR
jgi:sucrose-6-phosphate hydrolase SacC (GH32 family)